MKTAYYILTRFNTGLYSAHRKGKRYGRMLTRDQWMQQRMQLFCNICVPSIKAQTCQDFVWLLAVDPRTPRNYIVMIKEVLKGIPYILLNNTLSHARKGDATVHFKQHVKERVIVDTPDYLITTRLDNDDALNKNFVAKVREHLIGKETQILDFPIGWSLSWIHKKIRPIHPRVCTHFLSIGEFVHHPGKILTAFACTHGSAAKRFLVEQAEKDTPMWLETCHGHNLANSYQQYKLANGISPKWTAKERHLSEVQEDFGIHEDQLFAKLSR